MKRKVGKILRTPIYMEGTVDEKYLKTRGLILDSDEILDIKRTLVLGSTGKGVITENYNITIPSDHACDIKCLGWDILAGDYSYFIKINGFTDTKIPDNILEYIKLSCGTGINNILEKIISCNKENKLEVIPLDGLYILFSNGTYFSLPINFDLIKIPKKYKVKKGEEFIKTIEPETIPFSKEVTVIPTKEKVFKYEDFSEVVNLGYNAQNVRIIIDDIVNLNTGKSEIDTFNFRFISSHIYHNIDIIDGDNQENFESSFLDKTLSARVNNYLAFTAGSGVKYPIKLKYIVTLNSDSDIDLADESNTDTTLTTEDSSKYTVEE